MLDLGSLVYFIRAKNEDFTRVMRDTESKLQNTRNEFEKTSQTISKVGAAFTAAGAVIIGTIVGLTNKSKGLNAELANIGTLIPGNISRLKELKEEIREVSEETGKTTKDLAAGTYQLISAMGDAADTTEKLKINAKAAKAGIAETKDAINLTSAVVKSYGDTTAKAVQKASDLAFITVKLGQTTFPELASSIGKVTPLAAQLNVTQEEMFAIFATLTGVTGETAEVSTQAAAIMRAFIKPTNDMSKAIEQLGYKSASALLADKGLVGALKAVVSTTDGTEESVASLFGRAEALVAVFSLAGNQSETFRKKLADLQKAAGATDKAFDEQTKGINKAGFEWEVAMRKMEVSLQKLGDALTPAMEALALGISKSADLIKYLVGLFEALPDPVQKGVAVLTALLGVLLAITGPVLLLIGWLPQITAGIGTLNTLIPVLTLGMKGLTASFGPFMIGGAIILGLMATVSWLKKIRQEQDLIRKDAESITDPNELQKKIKLQGDQLKIARANVIASYGREAFDDSDQLTEEVLKTQSTIVKDYIKARDDYNAAVKRSINLSRNERGALTPPITQETTGEGASSKTITFDQAKAEFERQAFYQNMSLEEERTYWQKYVAIRAKGVEEVFESDKWLAENQEKINEEALQSLQERIEGERSRRIQHLSNLQSLYNHEVAMGRMNLEQQIAFQESILKSGKLDSDEFIQQYRQVEQLRNALERENQEIRNINISKQQEEINQKIVELNAQKSLNAMQINNKNLKQESLSFEKQIAELEVKKIELQIAELENQKKIALEKNNQKEVLELELKILKLQNEMKGVKISLDLSEKQQMFSKQSAEYRDLHGGISSAIQTGFNDHNAMSAIDSFVDYFKQKLRKNLADSIADALMSSGSGGNWLSNLGSLFGGGGTTGESNFLSKLFGGGASASGTTSGTAGTAGAAGGGMWGTIGGIVAGTLAGSSMQDNKKIGVGATAGSLIGSIWGPIGSMVGGMAGGIIDSLFGSSSKEVTVQANNGVVNADYATANFKEITLPSSYMGSSGSSSNAVAPVYDIDVNVTAKNTVVTQSELKQYLKEAANEAITEATAASNKWQAITISTKKSSS